MNTAEQILVVILASTLALFLVLSIVAIVKFIQILNHLKRMAEKAEKLADSAERLGEFFQNAAGPASVMRLLSNIAHGVFKHKKGGKQGGEDG